MNTKVLKKVSNLVRLKKEGDYWVVESRNFGDKDWYESPTYSSLKRALRQKHNLTQRVIRDIGLQPFFKERRINKWNKKRKKLYKKGKLKLA